MLAAGPLRPPPLQLIVGSLHCGDVAAKGTPPTLADLEETGRSRPRLARQLTTVSARRCRSLAPSSGASNMSIGLVYRANQRLNKNAISPPPAATARYRQSTNVAGGRTPKDVPDNATANCGDDAEADDADDVQVCGPDRGQAPFSANANVPARSKISSTGGSGIAKGSIASLPARASWRSGFPSALGGRCLELRRTSSPEKGVQMLDPSGGVSAGGSGAPLSAAVAGHDNPRV
jgi:hypothetical protein